MKLTKIIAVSAMAAIMGTTAFAEGKVIGVSWSNFQEERWKTDEAAMVAAIEANGDSYISADAQSSSSKQLSDIESLIAQGADALIKAHPQPHRLKVFAQLEGKNIGIVLPDADLDVAASQVVLGSLSYNGQRCTAVKLVMVHESIADRPIH